MNHDPTRTTTNRGEQIARLHREYARRLERRVAQRARADEQTVEDACSFAWLQLIVHPAVELHCPQATLAWLAQTAMRETWRLNAIRAAEAALAVGVMRGRHELSSPAVDELVGQRARLQLVAQVPDRPRRFLLRAALGHTQQEIADAERASLRTTSKQIARARQRLRALDADGADTPEAAVMSANA